MVKNPLKPSKTGAMRKALKMRKDSIFKKAHELSVLCGAEVGVLIFGPDHIQDSTTTAIPIPHVWPQTPQDFHNIIAKYQSTDEPRKQKALNSSNFMIKEENVDYLEVPGIENLSVDQLVDLVGFLDSKLGILEERIGFLMSVENHSRLAMWERLLMDV